MAAARRERPALPRAVVEVGGDGPVAIADVVAVARCSSQVALARQVGPRLRRARAVVEAHLGRDEPVYGLTTGLGAGIDTRLDADDVAAFQGRAVMARAVAVGTPLTTEEVRATLFARLAGLARGASGISPGLADALRDMLNAGVHPIARRTGSLGEADLAPLAGLLLPLAGGGSAEFGGEVLPRPQALERARISPPRLGPKDGIALINANSFCTGIAALAWHDIDLAVEALTVAGALSLEAFRANLSVIDPRVVALRSAPGQAEMSRRLALVLAGSDLLEPGRARRVQDPLSFRCLAPVHGVIVLRQEEARRAIEAELDGAGDSPAVLVEEGVMLSTVGFDTTALALAFQGLAAAMSHGAALAVSRTSKLMSAEMSGLPRFLTRAGASRTGFATLQKTAAVLEAEIRHLALPVGAMTAPVADGVEDYAPMTPRVVETAHAVARRVTRLAAIELVIAAEAAELRDGIRLGRGTELARAFVRRRVAPLSDDRPTGIDVESVAAAIEAGALRGELREGES